MSNTQRVYHWTTTGRSTKRSIITLCKRWFARTRIADHYRQKRVGTVAWVGPSRAVFRSSSQALSLGVLNEQFLSHLSLKNDFALLMIKRPVCLWVVAAPPIFGTDLHTRSQCIVTCLWSPYTAVRFLFWSFDSKLLRGSEVNCRHFHESGLVGLKFGTRTVISQAAVTAKTDDC